jgi:hypothetical protein
MRLQIDKSLGAVYSEPMPKQKSERDSIDDITARLSKKYPKLSASEVADVVEKQYAKLQTAKLREYIPVLVEHQAKQVLREKKR